MIKIERLLSAHLFKYILIILGAICIFVFFKFLFSSTTGGSLITEDNTRIAHIYSISENAELVVDTWDCGATCANNTAVYVRVHSEKGWRKTKNILSCYRMSGMEFSDVTSSSARISGITDLGSDCRYNVGDIIHF